MDFNNITTMAVGMATAVALKILGAIILWIVGRFLIKIATRLITKALSRQSIDSTITSYVANTVSVLLTIALVVALLGFFGVETTTFAALIAAAGIAIGAAWSGLLANFAAGAFLVILRPFKKGDFITAGGVTGTVEEVGLFVTTLNTPDNVRTFVGNNKMFSDNIQNFSANSYRRVDLTAQLDGSVDHNDAMTLLKAKLAKIPNVLAAPAPDVEIMSFNPMGPVLAVRPYCHTNDYWQVYFDANKVIRESFGEAGYPAPMPSMLVKTAAAGMTARA